MSSELTAESHPNKEKYGIPAKYREKLAKYREPTLWKSLWQLISTLVLFLAAYIGMWWNEDGQLSSVWVTVALSVPAGLMIIRLFVIHHDCGHGSFFQSKKANDFFGFFLGAMALTPYQPWRWSHAMHHSASGDLTRRGHGDIPTMTVKEYVNLSWSKRLLYRLYRSPLVLFGLSPFVLFVFIQRFGYDMPKSKKVRTSLWRTNLLLAAYVTATCLMFNVETFLIVHIPMTLISSGTGIWLFYVQHQYEETYWKDHDEWIYADAALHGSSYYKLPKVLQWITANIGLHHIHHLDSRIPNYRLQEVLDENPEFLNVKTITLWSSLRCAFVRLWDEDKQSMVTFKGIGAKRRKIKHEAAKAKSSAAEVVEAVEDAVTKIIAPAPGD